MARATTTRQASSTPWSLRRRLFVAVSAALAISLAAFSILLDQTFARTLQDRLDDELDEDARSVAALFEERAAGRWEVESGPGNEGRFEDIWYEVRTDDGALLLVSRGAGLGKLPGLTGPLPRRLDIRLPDGKPGRVLEAAVSARPEEEIEPSGRKLQVRVARSTTMRDATLAAFRFRLLVAGLCACAFSALLSLVAAQQGLRVLDALGARFDRLDADRLEERIPEEQLPRELLPPVRKLNELLGRLRASLDRERRFNADVSHELRTPLSGMQAILELALSRDRSAADYKDAIVRAHGVARDQQRLVESLLALSRAEAGQLEPRREPVLLREICDLAFAAVSDEAAARGLRFENKVAPELAVTSDPGLLRAIAGNLVSNAAAYTERGGWISVESDPSQGLWLSVQDSGPPLPDGKAEQIFERFVRLDGARAADGHHGIGLSLVRALSSSLGLTVAAQNRTDGTVAFEVREAPAKA